LYLRRRPNGAWTGDAARSVEPGAGVLLTFPDDPLAPAAWAADVRGRAGHIDGYGGRGTSGWHGGEMLRATTYLDRVGHRGGALLLWPRSHLAAHRHFRARPEPGSNRQGVQGAHSNPLGLFLNPLGLFLCTSIPFIQRILSAFLRA
jgi:hypothetical protein